MGAVRIGECPDDLPAAAPGGVGELRTRAVRGYAEHQGVQSPAIACASDAHDWSCTKRRLSKSLYLILVGESRTIVIKYASGASVRLQGNDFSAQ
jgi:hypothetical protein